MTTAPWSVLAAGLEASSLSTDQWRILEAWELSDPCRAQAWGITPDSVRSTLEQRLDWLRRLQPTIDQLPLPPAPITQYLPLLWQLWIPLALRLDRLYQSQAPPLIYGLLGGQGTGKTTLSRILQQLLRAMGRRMVGFSIDDIYKTYADRQQIRHQDPRLIWRGPPGTHDIALGVETLKQVRNSQGPVAFPRFDKSRHGGEGDRCAPEIIEAVDIVLFEGWFLGVRPLPAMDWRQAPFPIQSESDRHFAQDMNDRLAAYVPLWDELDQLMVMIPEDYRLSQQWRLQAEQQMKAQGLSGMADEAVMAFVQYFWKALHPELFILPLREAEWVDLVVEINADRQPQAIYSPSIKSLEM
ncbi:glycerate kinase [filamentous cyanobacterium CCP5]|nr:glycerate kinase [filamentous cyanobacterium CCP5]